MAATASRARVKLNKYKVQCKNNFDQRPKIENTKIKYGEYMWQETQGGKGKDKLGEHTKGPFLILAQTTRTFVIQRDDLVGCVNDDRFYWAPVTT